jgi:uncharacterized iron-regulated membrane protein
MKRALRFVHKYLSLTMAAMWLLQAATGVLLVFHWELDDWAVSGPQKPLHPDKLSASLELLQNTRPAQRVTALYTSGGLPGRFDVVITHPNGGRNVLRVDGEGAILRERPWDHDYAHIGAFQIATYLHQTLFLHTAGNWIIGLSGILLLSNICLGMYQAWPRAGQWLRTLSPFTVGHPAAQLYHWHRALGLALALPALLLVFAGIVRAFDDPLAAHFEAARPPPTGNAQTQPRLQPPTLANVISTALALYPGSRLAAVELPDSDAPWFAVRVTQSHDVRRFFGTTIVYISNQNGGVLENYDAKLMPPRVQIWDAVYALHTGEMAGTPGRCLAVLVGLSLLVLIALGLSLYFLRRARAQYARLSSSAPRSSD